MATRRLVTRTCTPVASALRRRPGPAMPPAARSQFLDAMHSQNGIAIRRFSDDLESTRDLLEKAKKHEVFMRKGIKWISRVVKAQEWACYFCVSVTIAAAVTISQE